MDGSFACPECGNSVRVHGLAPGRQVRCGFCRRLLEIPYLPRADVRWKRKRFERPRWIYWCYVAIAIVAAVLLSAAGLQLVKQRYRSEQDRSISHLIASSHKNEAEGRIDQALIDLDAALELAEKAGPASLRRVERERRGRQGLARRDVDFVLKGLRAPDSSTFPVGDWLGLIARAERDPDLEALVRPLRQEFHAALLSRTSADLDAARRAFDEGRAADSLRICDRLAVLSKHLLPAERDRALTETEKVVLRLVTTHGVSVAAPRGTFVFGSLTSYVKDLLPVVISGLEKKGYLPARESSPWRDLWKDARYQMKLDVREQLEGSYLSSGNRLTRIEAHLSIARADELFWETIPTARSTVPLPRLSAYVAGRAAASTERSPEFERLLYNDARGQINEKFSFALTNMPPCPRKGL